MQRPKAGGRFLSCAPERKRLASRTTWQDQIKTYVSQMRQLLTPKSLLLLDELEKLSGKTIPINPVTPSIVAEFPIANRETSCRTTEQGTEIFYPESGTTEQDLVHELLHIQRYWVEKAPIMEMATSQLDGNAYAIRQLCNDLEHCVIIPREQRYLPDSTDSLTVWSRKYDQYLNDCEYQLKNNKPVKMTLTRH